MNYESLVQFVQEQFADGLVLVIGSGLSAAEGIPGMPELAAHLSKCAKSLSGNDAALWDQIQVSLDAKEGLEAALLRHRPSDSLELWIAKMTANLLIPKEREVIGAVMRGAHTLRLSIFLNNVLRHAGGLPILTPNYDRLVEVACEMAGFHVDTTAIGNYAGEFDHTRSCMASCKGIVTRAKTTMLDHFPRAIVLKPHGSLDWYRIGNEARRCSIDIDGEHLIITPGINKYRAGYDAPFDKHRELANDYIKQAARLLIVGYGFNDDHLQTHLVKRIVDGTPTLILNRAASSAVETIIKRSPSCVCLSKSLSSPGTLITTTGSSVEHEGSDIWDLGVLTKELLT